MGTIFRITVYASNAEVAEKAASEAFDRIEKLEAALSFYQDESELNQVSDRADDQVVNVSPDLFRVLESALQWSRKTGGAFDCTVRPLITMWQDRGRQGRLPTPKEIREVKRIVGFNKVLLNPRLKSVRLESHGMQLDLGGIAKGYAADEAFRVLFEYGLTRILIDAGGDLLAGTPPPGEKGWLVTLENLQEGNSRLYLSNSAIATSGDTYRYFEIDGNRYSHIVNPATGMGMTDHRQVTVLARDGQSADALATSLSVMDIQQGLQLVESLDDIEVLIRLSGSGGPGPKSQNVSSSGFPALF